MAIPRTTTLHHWNYFLALEEDLVILSRYIDFSENTDATGSLINNDYVYSSEIQKLLLSMCSEVEVVLKELCKKLNPNVVPNNIKDIYDTVKALRPKLVEFKATIPRFGLLTLDPWKNWRNSITSGTYTSPQWWEDYNSIKHNRSTNYHKANLKNCINAATALYIVNLYLYESEAEKGELLNLPKLFNVDDQNFAGTQMGRYGNSFKYKF